MSHHIIDTFLFSEEYEKELLLLKLHLESPLVSQFVLVESDVTFRGEHKGFQARKMVQADERFAPFRGKLAIVENVGRLFDGPPCYNTFYENEERSRALAWDWVHQNVRDLHPDTWLLFSDVDEAVDCTDDDRLERFVTLLADHWHDGATLYFCHYRYWYDFDNRCYWTGICTPATQAKSILNGDSTTRCRSRHVKNRIDVPAGDNPIVFEYTFCFPPEAMWKKLNSFIHDGYSPEELADALKTNHWVKARARGERPGQQGRIDWLETVELTPENSPSYVRENLPLLKTGVIPSDYREHRKRIYGV